jgi:predicted MFS family arabinose efflux permease
MSTFTAVSTRIHGISRELKLFAAASFMMGVAYNIFDTTFNNFLNERFTLTGFERSFLEAPRELPGLLVVFVTALLWFLCSRRLGVVAMLLGVAGALLIGFVSPTYTVMVIWLFVYSLGSHLFMPVAQTIGMELAREGKTGQRLGQLNALRNLAAIFGSFIVFLGFRYLGFSFDHTFIITAVMLALAGFLMFFMKREVAQPSKTYLKLHPEYRLYYFLAILHGARKQIFITFAPWVLVNIFNQPTQILAQLFLIGGIIGIIFQPLLGWTIDHLGERFVLASEAVLLIFVCAGYGFAKFLLPEATAFLVICGCFLVDQMLMSVSMARSTYMKKIAMRPEDIQPALTTSVSIDHIFSISIALLGGLIWNAFGFQYVFALGAVIAVINFFAAMQIRIPAVQKS